MKFFARRKLWTTSFFLLEHSSFQQVPWTLKHRQWVCHVALNVLQVHIGTREIVGHGYGDIIKAKDWQNDRHSFQFSISLIRRVARNSQWGRLFWGSGGRAPSHRRPMGVWGRSPHPLEAGGLEAKPPAAGGTRVWHGPSTASCGTAPQEARPQRSKILHFFCKNNFILGLF